MKKLLSQYNKQFLLYVCFIFIDVATLVFDFKCRENEIFLFLLTFFISVFSIVFTYKIVKIRRSMVAKGIAKKQFLQVLFIIVACIYIIIKFIGLVIYLLYLLFLVGASGFGQT